MQQLDRDGGSTTAAQRLLVILGATGVVATTLTGPTAQTEAAFRRLNDSVPA